MRVNSPDQGRKGAVAVLESVPARQRAWEGSIPLYPPSRTAHPRPPVTLIELDGSASSSQALKYAAGSPGTSPLTPVLLLLYVSPSGRAGDLETGRLELEKGRRTCQVLSDGAEIRTRLEVGKASEAIPAVARDEEVDLIVMGSHRLDGFPHMEGLSLVARETISCASCPVVVISPSGADVSPAEAGGMRTRL